MNQPKWKCIAQLGDVNPVDYGGYWVFIDETGVHQPEGEYLETPYDEDGEYRAYRFSIDRCTLTDGILSDNPFHPLCPAWFAKPETERETRPQDTTYLSNVANYCGSTVDEIQAALCGDDIPVRAEAYRMVAEYHGWENMDSYPLTMSRSEAKKRYRLKKYSVR